jgi:hypothetical protein
MQNPMRPLLSLERLRLLEQSMIMMRLTVATILSAKGSPAVFEFSLSNLLQAVDYTFTFTNGTAGSADYTTTSQTVNLRVLLREL